MEILGYAISFVLSKLRDDIEATHGWTDETYDLNHSYKFFIARAFAKVFGVRVKKGETDIFNDIFNKYYLLIYDDDNDKFEEKNIEDIDGEEEIKIIITRDDDTQTNSDEEVEKFYVYRISKLFNVKDEKKVIENVRQYKDIGLSYYEDAFFNIPIDKIEKEIAKTAFKTPSSSCPVTKEETKTNGTDSYKSEKYKKQKLSERLEQREGSYVRAWAEERRNTDPKNLTPRQILFGAMIYGLSCFGKKDTRRSMPPELKSLGVGFDASKHYSGDAALFELGCYMHFRLDHWLFLNKTHRRKEISSNFVQDFTDLFTQVLGTRDLSNLFEERVSGFGRLARNDVDADEYHYHLSQLVLRAKDNQPPAPYDFKNAPVIISDISEDMGVKIALTSWEHGMIPAMIICLQNYCDLTDSNRKQKAYSASTSPVIESAMHKHDREKGQITAFKEYCPTCQKTVEFELSDGEYCCLICGRTKKVSENKIKHDKQRANAKKLKITVISIGIALLLFLVLWMFSMVSKLKQ
ncbi:MAG: hypothetical protein ACUZ8I_16310 [Candidatus Scalindua sp.]